MFSSPPWGSPPALTPPGPARTPCPTTLFLAQCDPGRRILVGSPDWSERWETRICEAGSGSLQIFAPRTATGPLRRFPGALLAVQIPTPGALFTLECVLEAESASAAPVWILGGFAELQRIQRRRAPRFRGHFEAEVIDIETADPYPLDFHLPTSQQRNISTTGCYLLANRGLPLGTRLELRIGLAHRPEPISLEGEVVRREIHPEGLQGHGIDFGELPASDQTAINRLIALSQRRSPDSLWIS